MPARAPSCEPGAAHGPWIQGTLKHAAPLEDILRDVGYPRAQYVLDVDTGNMARHVRQRDVERDEQLLLCVVVEFDGRLQARHDIRSQLGRKEEAHHYQPNQRHRPAETRCDGEVLGRLWVQVKAC